MTTSDDAKALAPLVRIAARYGCEPLVRLAELLKDPQRASELAAILEIAAAQASRSNGGQKPRANDRVGMGVLNDLRMSDPDRHAVIAEIRSHLMSGKILQSMSDLRNFARRNSLNIGKASSRNAAISPLLRSLSSLPLTEIVSLRDSMITFNSDDRSLARWRDVIVRS